MKKNAWKSYLLWIGVSEGTGLLAGLLTRDAAVLYGETAAKPPLSPPAIVFPIVWTILYALMGIGAARIALTLPSRSRTHALLLFVTQLVFNFCWSILFFNLQAYGFAFFWLLALWALILWMILKFRKIDPLAAALQIPYLIWVTFAAYLNLGVQLLNR